MLEISIALAIASFVAGLFMFLAPCTLPLVPAYLAFIGGVKSDQINQAGMKRKIIINAIAFVIGFGLVFTIFGMLAGYFGSFVGAFRGVLAQVGGVFIILFGFLMLGFINIKSLSVDRKITLPKIVTPGTPSSAFIIGSIFAIGWTPCVGPVLASVLLLAATSTTVFSGGVLLFIFSLGLAIPFLLTAILYSRATRLISKYAYVSKSISVVGGVFLIIIGLLLLSDNFGLMVQYGYIVFNSIGFEALFNYY